MMDKVYIGKVVTTHGIKGEIRILSDFKYKDKAFCIGNELIINNDILHIKSYRIHKGYNMVSFNEYDNINDVLKYMKSKVYIDRIYLKDIKYLDEDLIGMDIVVLDKIVGKIKDVINVKNNPLLLVNINNEDKYIPNNKEFIENVDLSSNKVYIKYMEGLL